MKKAVIQTGGHQYIVQEGQVLEVDLISDKKTIQFDALLVIDGDKTSVGTPNVSNVSVGAKVLEEVRADKVTAIRYKAKKRVRKVRGHRQKLSKIEITKIS